MKLIIALLYGIIFVGMIFYNGYMHELVHQSIFEDYGVDSKIQIFKYFPHFAAEANYTQYFKYCNETCRTLHSQNEIEGYNSSSLLILIGFGFFIIILLVEIAIHLLEEQNERRLKELIEELK